MIGVAVPIASCVLLELYGINRLPNVREIVHFSSGALATTVCGAVLRPVFSWFYRNKAVNKKTAGKIRFNDAAQIVEIPPGESTLLRAVAAEENELTVSQLLTCKIPQSMTLFDKYAIFKLRNQIKLRRQKMNEEIESKSKLDPLENSSKIDEANEWINSFRKELLELGDELKQKFYPNR